MWGGGWLRWGGGGGYFNLIYFDYIENFFNLW